MNNGAVQSSLKNLVVFTAFANNEDAYLELLTEEERIIKESLLKCEDYIQHLSISQATIDGIFDTFNQNWQRIGIFHYAGHANGTHLHLEDSSANAQGLMSLIKEHGCIPLVFLNGCSTQDQANLLLEAGVGVVIATKTSIEDDSAVMFAERFYKTLAQDHTIEKAFNDAKSYLISKDSKKEEDFTYNRKRRGMPGLRVSEVDTAWTINVSNENVLSLKLKELKDYINRQRLLHPFLLWSAKRHEKTPISGLKGSTEIPLDKIYVTLRGELSKSYEILQTQKFYEEDLEELEKNWELENVSETEKKQKRSQLLGRSAIMPVKEEQDLKDKRTKLKTGILNLAEALIQHDKLVVLGDPGTGKTTLARWLVLMFAKSILEGNKITKIPTSMVNATTGSGVDSYNFGSSKLPILLRIGDFAQRKKENPKITIAQFIGHHSWMGKYPYYIKSGEFTNEFIDPESLNSLMCDFIHNGEALIILDGLDEISEDQERKAIVQDVHEFIDRSVDHPKTKNLKRRNKLIITSRIAGYHTCPVQNEELYHVTIQAMEPLAIYHFCNTWIKAVHLIASPSSKILQKEVEAAEMSSELNRMILSKENRGASDLATNPLLLTELCKIFYSEDQKLPNTRVELYEKAVENFLKVGEERLKTQTKTPQHFREKAYYILEDIAEYIHENYAAGLIITDQVEILTRNALEGFYRESEDTRASSIIESQVAIFLKWLREDVGVLAARAEELYGFLHLSFQEYFAARKLVRNKGQITEAILNRAYQARWREPLLMAIGTMDQHLLKKDRNKVLNSLLNMPDPMGNLVPRSANLIALAFSEMNEKPEGDLIKDVVIRLLQAYQETESFQDGHILRSNVLDTFKTLSRKDKETFSTVLKILDTVIRNKSFDRNIKNAAVDLLLNLNWNSQTILNSIIENRHLDEMSWGWPFHKTLQITANTNPNQLKNPSFHFRAFLEQYPDVIPVIEADVVWLRIIMLLYGAIIGKDKTYKFSYEGIIMDSSFTDEIIDLLEEQQPPDNLKTQCLEVWKSEYSEPKEKIDALLILTALGTPDVRDIRQLAKKGDSEITQGIIQRLSLLNQLFSLTIGVVGDKISVVLGSIIKNMDNDYTQWFVNSLVVLTTSFKGSGSSPMGWIMAMPKDLQARTLAELWVHSFNTSDDTLYNLAVIFDTVGKEIRSLGAETIARSFIEVNNVLPPPPQDKWATDGTPYQPKDLLDVLEEALYSIDAMDSKFDLFKFWALKEIKPLIDQQAEFRFKEHIKQILTRFQNLRYMQEVLRLYFPEIFDEIESDTHDTVIILSSAFTKWENEEKEDSVSFASLTSGTSGLKLLFEAKNKLINEPDKYLRIIFNELALLRNYDVTYLQQKNKSDIDVDKNADLLLHEAIEAISKLKTPVLEIKALLKLATLYNEKDRQEILEYALTATDRVISESELALILRELKPWVNNILPLSKKYIQASKRLKNFVNRAILENRNYPQFLSLPESSEKKFELAVLSIAALIRDGNNIFTLPQNTEELWEILLHKDFAQIPELINKIVTIGNKKMISLSLKGALGITNLLDKDLIDNVCQLMPVVCKPSRETLPVINEWLKYDDQRVQCFAALLLLESGHLNAKTFPFIEKIIFLAFSPIQDQYRNRTNIALNQQFFYASKVGVECLYQIGTTLDRKGGRSPFLIKGLSWLFERLYFDDPDILRDIILQAEGVGRKASIARLLIRRIHLVSDKRTFKVYLKGFYHSDFKIRKSFIKSSTFLFNKWRNVIQRTGQVKELKRTLIDCINSEDSEIPNYALYAIGHAQKLDDSDIEFLKKIIKNGNTNHKCEAIIAIGRHSFEDKDTYLDSLLKKEPELRLAAAESICRGIIKKTGDDLQTVIQLISEKLNDPQLILDGILGAARDNWWGAYSKKCVKVLGAYFDENPKVFKRFVQESEEVLRFNTAEKESGTLAEELHWMKQMVRLDGLSAGAEKLPITFTRQARKIDDFEGVLYRIATSSSIFTDRMNAIKCLSFLRKISDNVLTAFSAALKDVVYVQEEAIFSSERFQEIDRYVIDSLAAHMDNESLGARYAIIQMLAAIANYSKTESDIRQKILEVMLQKINDPDYNQHVYILKKIDEHDTTSELRFIGPLNHEIYKKILEVSGVQSLNTV